MFDGKKKNKKMLTPRPLPRQTCFIILADITVSGLKAFSVLNSVKCVALSYDSRASVNPSCFSFSLEFYLRIDYNGKIIHFC